jgi:transketolase
MHDLISISRKLRIDILEACCAGAGGHLGGAYSVLDILVAVYFGGILRPQDKVIFSKGHACLALYAVLKEKGLISDENFRSYNKNGGALGGHPKRDIPGVHLSTGALGHGLPVAAGMAYANRDARYICVVGDGEMNEGSCWEAAMFAAQHKLGNLILIVDNNRMESLAPTEQIMSVEPLKTRLRFFGWFAVPCDGHDHKEIISELPTFTSRPRAIIAHTVKGKGVSFMENTAKWHYRCPTPEERERALAELRGEEAVVADVSNFRK